MRVLSLGRESPKPDISHEDLHMIRSDLHMIIGWATPNWSKIVCIYVYVKWKFCAINKT